MRALAAVTGMSQRDVISTGLSIYEEGLPAMVRRRLKRMVEKPLSEILKG